MTVGIHLQLLGDSDTEYMNTNHVVRHDLYSFVLWWGKDTQTHQQYVVTDLTDFRLWGCVSIVT